MRAAAGSNKTYIFILWFYRIAAATTTAAAAATTVGSRLTYPTQPYDMVFTILCYALMHKLKLTFIKNAKKPRTFKNLALIALPETEECMDGFRNFLRPVLR